MKQEFHTELYKKLERARYTNRELDCWSGRMMHRVLGCKDWSSFLKVVEKAKVLCNEAGFPVRDHFSFGTRPMKIGKDRFQKIDEIGLTRYACYLITQNIGASNKTIAFALTYFSTQSRKLAVIEQRLLDRERLALLPRSDNKLSNMIYERGTDGKGFELIRTDGDEEVFGSYSAREMKEKLAVSNDTYYADFISNLPMMVIDIAIEVTLHNIRAKGLEGEQQISKEYFENSLAFRNMLLKRGIKPEALPMGEDTERIGHDLEYFRRMHMRA